MSQSWEMQVFTYYQNGILRFIQLREYLKEKGLRPIEAIRMVVRFISILAEKHTADGKEQTSDPRFPKKAAHALPVKGERREAYQSIRLFEAYIHTG